MKHKHLMTPWEAKGDAVFAGGDCIAICDTDNAAPEVYEAKARLMAAAPDLLRLAEQFQETVEYYIRADRKKGDQEGANMKGMTLLLIRHAIAKATGEQP